MLFLSRALSQSRLRLGLTGSSLREHRLTCWPELTPSQGLSASPASWPAFPGGSAEARAWSCNHTWLPGGVARILASFALVSLLTSHSTRKGFPCVCEEEGHFCSLTGTEKHQDSKTGCRCAHCTLPTCEEDSETISLSPKPSPVGLRCPTGESMWSHTDEPALSARQGGNPSVHPRGTHSASHLESYCRLWNKTLLTSLTYLEPCAIPWLPGDLQPSLC